MKYTLYLSSLIYSMLEVTTSYTYNQKTNSIDVEFSQKPILKEYYKDNSVFKIKELTNLEVPGKKVSIVDFKTRAARFFDVNLNVVIYQTNGIEVIKESHIFFVRDKSLLVCTDGL